MVMLLVIGLRQVCNKKWDRINKIMTLVPPRNADSPDDNNSTEPEELPPNTRSHEMLSDISSEPRHIILPRKKKFVR